MGCPPQVAAALNAIEGVECTKEDVSFADSTVTFKVKAGTDTMALVKAFEGSKFTASAKK